MVPQASNARRGLDGGVKRLHALERARIRGEHPAEGSRLCTRFNQKEFSSVRTSAQAAAASQSPMCYFVSGMHQPVRRVVDPYTETDVHYLVVGVDSMKPDIVEVEKGTPGSFRTLQEAKSHAMQLLRGRIEEATESLARIRAIGIEMPRMM